MHRGADTLCGGMHLGDGLGTVLSPPRDERLHQLWQLMDSRAGIEVNLNGLTRRFADQPVEVRLGLAQEPVYIISHHERCRRSLPGGPGGPFNVFSQSLSLPLKPASTAT